MRSLPDYFITKDDYYNGVDWCLKTGKEKKKMKRALIALRDTYTVKVLKESAKDKPSEEITDDDYEIVNDVSAKKYKLNFTDSEINKLIEKLGV